MTLSSILRPFKVALRAALVACTFAMVTPANAHAQQTMSPAAQKYLQQFVDKLRERAVNRDEVGWKSLENKAFAAAPNAQSIPDLYPAIKAAFNELGDKRAGYRAANNGPLIVADLLDCARPTISNPPQLPPEIGYLRLVPEPMANVRVMGDVATRIQSEIRTGDANGATSWIVDLRGYRQGNMAAALVGIGPLLGEGVVLYTIDISGNQTQYVAGENRVSSDGQVIQLSIAKVSLTHKKPRIAVLVGPATGGAGEMLAIAFTGRKDARTFGMPTCGMPPYVSLPIDLSDGAKLYVNSIVIADRFHKRFFGPIDPDEKVEDADQMIQAAVRWLTAGN